MTKRTKAVKKVATLLLNKEATELFWLKIRKRCLLEGCRYAYTPVEELKSECVYCGTPRPIPSNWFDGSRVEFLFEEK